MTPDRPRCRINISHALYLPGASSPSPPAARLRLTAQRARRRATRIVPFSVVRNGQSPGLLAQVIDTVPVKVPRQVASADLKVGRAGGGISVALHDSEPHGEVAAVGAGA